MTNELLGFKYEFINKKSDRTLLLLHGTGGDEKDLLALGERLDPKANLLSPRGKIMENGMARFFRRKTEGVFDKEDLRLRSGELAEFITEAQKKHLFRKEKVVAVGFSNGANIALHLLTNKPHILRKAILFRPMSQALPSNIGNLKEMLMFIGLGKNDAMSPKEEVSLLRNSLEKAGADVEIHVTQAGHGLVREDVRNAKNWLEKLPPK